MPRFNELRYALTFLIHERDPAETTVADLVDDLARHGVELSGRPSKIVSDTLRREVAADRVRRVGRGRYRAGALPGGTRARVRDRGSRLLFGDRASTGWSAHSALPPYGDNHREPH